MQRQVLPPITHVTVYPDGAMVRRQGQLKLTGEERSLLIPNLPTSLQANSVRVAGRGTVEVLLMGVHCHAATAPSPDQHPLVRQIQEQETQKQQLQTRREALQLQRRFIQRLSEQAVDPFAANLASQNLSLSKTQRFLQFIDTQYLQITGAIADLDQQEHRLDAQIAQQRQQLQTLYSAPSAGHHQLVIDIDPIGAGTWVLDCTYHVTAATWQPLYDCRWESGTDQLNLSYLAQVQQTTGEDWPQVQLTLATAPPHLGALPPSPTPWYIDLPPNPFVHLRYSRERYQSASEELESLEAVPDEADLETFPVTEPLEPAEPLTYPVLGANSIPSDRSPHTVTIQNTDLAITWRAIAIPRLAPQPELEVTLTNPPPGIPWLPGTATLFRDGAYRGKVSFPLVSPNESLPLRFGPDESLVVQRHLRDRKLDTNLRGHRQRQTYIYELELHNLATHPTVLQLVEQLPVSRNDKLKVQLQRTKPKVEADELGQMVWDLRLEAQTTQTVSYQFTVDYPADLPVQGLD